jgi:hypothetical protein
VCSARRLSIPTVTAETELAVEWNGATFTAVWLDHGAVMATSLDAALTAQPITRVVRGPVDGIAGVVSLSATTLVTTVTGGSQTLWSSPGLGAGTEIHTETSVAARASIVGDATKIPRAWVRGGPTGMIASYVRLDATLGADAPLPTPNPVISIAGADNSDHGHVTWTERIGASAQCFQADLDFVLPTLPTLAGGDIVSDDCLDARIDSGPPAMDAILTAWRTTPRTIEVRYHGGVVNVARNLSVRGRAPRPRFDGTRFWVAWIDEPSQGDRLRIATVEEDLTMNAVDVSGWEPVSDRAFELVRGADGVYLFLLGTDTLSILKTCP